MVKGGFWDDTMEKALEFGKSTGSRTTKAVSDTFSPVKLAEKAMGKDDKGIEKPEKKGPVDNHTPLNLDKLKDKYRDQDRLKMESMKKHLFQLVKSEEEKAQQEIKQEELEKKRKEAYEEEEKKRKKQQAESQQQQTSEPHGKERRSIFTPKKTAKREQTEVRPSSGKQ